MRGGRVSLGDCRKVLDLFFKGKSFKGRVRVSGSAFLASFLSSKDETLINEGRTKVCTSCQGTPKALSNFYFKKTENRYEAICLECKKKKVSARAKKRIVNRKNLLETGRKFIRCDFSDVSEKFDKGLSQSEFSLNELVFLLVN